MKSLVEFSNIIWVVKSQVIWKYRTCLCKSQQIYKAQIIILLKVWEDNVFNSSTLYGDLQNLFRFTLLRKILVLTWKVLWNPFERLDLQNTNVFFQMIWLICNYLCASITLSWSCATLEPESWHQLLRFSNFTKAESCFSFDANDDRFAGIICLIYS